MVARLNKIKETTMHEPSFIRRMLRSDIAVLWLSGLGIALLHIAASGRYGFHRDELLSYSNAIHLDWCYVVYPPLTAWLARAELELFGTSLVGYRLLPAVAVALIGVLAGLIVRELGGKRQAMLVACAATSIEGPIFFAGTFFSYMTFDILWWVAAAWCVACLLRSQNPRWWIGIGVVIGLGMLTKYAILFLVAGILAGVIFTPNRRFLRSPWFWAGIAVTLVITMPVIVWQFQHHFVGLTWAESIHARDVRWGRANHFLVNQFWNVTSVVTVPLWIAGLWYLMIRPQGKPFRVLGWMYVVPLVLFALAKGRDYYMAGAYPMLMAAGAVWGEQKLAAASLAARNRALRTVWISLTVASLVLGALILPIAPINSYWWRAANGANGGFNMEIGWPELVATVASVRDSLPEAERAHIGVIAGDEGEAGAVNLYGRAYGLPQAISGMNSNWLRGYGNPPPQTVIAVGMDRAFLFRNFTACRWAAQLSNPYGVVNDTIGGDYAAVYVCGPPVKGWPEFWKNFQYYG